MKWKGRRASTNVQDARGRRVTRGAGGLTAIVNVVFRLLGLKGILILGILGVIGWQMGLIDPAALLSDERIQQVDYQPTAADEELFGFVSVVLADTEDIWTNEFNRIGQKYEAPELVVFQNRYPTACGIGDARMGPFYCPADQKVYIAYDDL